MEGAAARVALGRWQTKDHTPSLPPRQRCRTSTPEESLQPAYGRIAFCFVRTSVPAHELRCCRAPSGCAERRHGASRGMGSDHPRGRVSAGETYWSCWTGGSRRHDLRERGVLALVGGSEHHSLYANPRQYPQKEESVLRSRAVQVSTRKQQVSLSCGTTTELWWPQLRNHTDASIGTRKRCGACALKAQCTSGRYKYLAIHMDETARQHTRELVDAPEFAKAGGKERRWKPCSRNSRIRSDCVACAWADWSSCGSSSSWQPWHRMSSGWCGSPANRQALRWKLPLN